MTGDERTTSSDARTPDAQSSDALAEVHAKRGLLLRLAYRFLWNAEDAEDAVQTALLRATERQDQLADASRVWSWVRAIVVRQCMDVRRQAQRNAKVEQHAKQHATTSNEKQRALDALTTDETHARLRSAINELPERQQAAIVLRHLEELTYAEIATILGITESTVRVQVRNARDNLARLMKDRD